MAYDEADFDDPTLANLDDDVTEDLDDDLDDELVDLDDLGEDHRGDLPGYDLDEQVAIEDLEREEDV
jgi:hypothetical protein